MSRHWPGMDNLFIIFFKYNIEDKGVLNMYYIYKITNKINGMVYIGSTNEVERR